MCVECGTVLSVSSSPVALQERAFIREQIAAGKDKAQIKAALVDEYGEDVLAAARGATASTRRCGSSRSCSCCSPPPASAIAIKRWRGNAGEPVEAELPPPLSAEDARRLDAELRAA